MTRSTRFNGFTILEVLIASGILVTVSGAMLATGRASIRSHDLSMERTQASHLVQEAFEVVRQIRDTNYIDGEATAWNSGLVTGVDEKPVWNPDIRRWQLVPGEETVQVDGTTALTYSRTIRLEPAANLAEIHPGNAGTSIEPSQVAYKVTVTVQWQSQGQDWTESASSLVTDWNIGASL